MLDDEVFLTDEHPKGRNRVRRFIADYFPAAIALAVCLLLWESSYLLITIPAYILPAPHSIADRIVTAFPLLMRHSWVTLQETVWGFAGGALLGVFLALLITNSRVLSKTLYTLIIASQVVPKVAVAPLLIVWFGYGLMPKIVVTALLAFFPVVIATVTGLLAVPPDTIDVLRSVAASRWQIFAKLMFPNSLPYLFSGLKVAITLSVVGAIVGEWVGADSGLGYLIQIANSQMDTELMFAAFVVLVTIGIALFALVALIEWLVMPWHEKVDISVTM